MPIAFPSPKRGAPWTWPEKQRAGAAISYAQTGAQYVPNLIATDPGLPFKQNTFGGWVVPAQRKYENLRRLGTVFVNPNRPQTNQVPLLVRFPVVAQQTGASSFTISGIAYDSTGSTPQAGAVVDLFRTAGDVLEQSTVSDSSGAFWFSQMQAGPFYIVAYKPGSPDIAGTTVNTINPA
jgi:hypothetical protein